jgi:hypothetical protein
MARPYRLKFENACYLVTLKGVDGLGLFVESSDAAHFVDLLGLNALKHQVIVHAYALAENSAALVLETPKANLSVYLQGIQTAFARHIRQFYVHKGPIMKDRYRAKVLEKEVFLAKTCEWVHTFPFHNSDATPAAKCKQLAAYPFSSYRFTLGEVASGMSQPAELLKTYGSPVKNRADSHRFACETQLREGTAAWESRMKESTVAIGSDAFVHDMELKHAAVLTGKRVKGLRQYGRKVQGISRTRVTEEAAKTFGVPKEDFFVQRHGSVLRPVISAFLYQHAAMTQQEIAAYLGLGSAAAVSLQIKQLLTLRLQDPKLDKLCLKLEKNLVRG